MPFDTAIADRIRDIVQDEPGISEQRMFGGLAFLVGGHMAVADEDQMAAALRDAYPYLSVEVVRQGVDAVETLIERSRRAELLLLGRPYAEDHWRAKTGPLVARLVREARSPSMLVGGVGAHGASGA